MKIGHWGATLVLEAQLYIYIYIYIYIRGRPPSGKLITISSEGNILCTSTLPADVKPDRSEEQDGMPANLHIHIHPEI